MAYLIEVKFKLHQFSYAFFPRVNLNVVTSIVASFQFSSIMTMCLKVHILAIKNTLLF